MPQPEVVVQDENVCASCRRAGNGGAALGITNARCGPNRPSPRRPTHLPARVERMFDAATDTTQDLDTATEGGLADPALSALSDSELEAELCTHAAHVTVAECRLTLLLGELDRRPIWAERGLS